MESINYFAQSSHFSHDTPTNAYAKVRKAQIVILHSCSRQNMAINISHVPSGCTYHGVFLCIRCDEIMPITGAYMLVHLPLGVLEADTAWDKVI